MKALYALLAGLALAAVYLWMALTEMQRKQDYLEARLQETALQNPVVNKDSHHAGKEALRSLERRFQAHVENDSAHVQSIQSDGRAKCAINPSLVYEDTGQTLPECPPLTESAQRGGFKSIWDPKRSMPQQPYMLSLPGEWDAYSVRRAAFQRSNMSLRRFRAVEGIKEFAKQYQYRKVNGKNVSVFLNAMTGDVIAAGDAGFLTPGERGYLASMQRLFEELITDPKLQSVLVLDDDALLHCNFDLQLKRVLSDPRCGDPVSHDGKGGVLLLGTAVWINGTYPERSKWTGGWAQSDHDMKLVEGITGRETHCFNVDRKSLGSFGVIYHRHTFQTIIDWCMTADVPFDHIWHHLTTKGFPVRAAYPNVVIQDVRHTSSVDPSRRGQEDMSERADKHRWDLSQFCDPETGKPLLEL